MLIFPDHATLFTTLRGVLWYVCICETGVFVSTFGSTYYLFVQFRVGTTASNPIVVISDFSDSDSDSDGYSTQDSTLNQVNSL